MKRHLSAVLTWIAYVDVVAALFATGADKPDVALLLLMSGLSLVVAAVCFDVLSGGADGQG